MKRALNLQGLEDESRVYPLIDLMKRHRSIRKFTSQPVTSEQIQQIIQAAQAASSSNHVQAYSIIGVTDQQKKERIAALANNQKHIAQCSIFLLFCGDLYRLAIAAEMRGVKPFTDYLEIFMVALIDTAVAGQNAMLALESMGLGGVFVGGVRNAPEAIGEIVGLPDLTIPLFGMSIGYPTEDPEVKPRLPMSVLYHENEYKRDHFKEELTKYDQEMRAYYERRSWNTKDLDWTKSMASYLSDYRRLHMQPYVKRKGFDLK